jgi:hypothetical protein
MAALGATGLVAAPAKGATGVAGKTTAGVASAPRAGHKAHPRSQRISARGSATSAHHGRRRKGSDPTEQDKPAAGEVVGGLGASHPGAHLGKGAKKVTSLGRHRVARVIPTPKPPCLHDAVEVERGFGGDVQPVVLTRCDGRPAPNSIEQMSVLVRPMNLPKPTVMTTPIRHGVAEREWLPGVKLVHEGLVTRLQHVVDHFQAKKITVVSGYRPSSLGSFHQSARAVDFHIDGVSNEALVAFCRTLQDTGCGYYPNSSFVHLDVRAPRTGHVYWIDASGPGEPAHYVATWPPKDGAPKPNEIPRPDPAAPLDEQTHLDSAPQLPPGASDTKVDARTTQPLSTGDGKDDPFAP